MIIRDASDVRHEYDYVIVGGGTAGCILAARLSEDPEVRVALLEAGPSDADEPRATAIRRWDEMVESEYDLDYLSVPNERGNSDIRQARMRILGGCSTANTMITWRPLDGDLHEWVRLGAQGWDPEAVQPYFDRIAAPYEVVAEADRNPHLQRSIEAASRALAIPVQDGWNVGQPPTRGAGFFEIGYTPETNARSSASRAYLHEPGAIERPNLHLVLTALATRIVIDDRRASGVIWRDGDGVERTTHARREVIVCAGAIDSPALLQRSGIGARQTLERAGIDVLVDLPGVGENLQDHAEGLLVWELDDDIPDVRATGWDAGYVYAFDDDADVPDVSTHIPVTAWAVHAENRGVQMPARIMSLVPNVAKPASRGRVWVESPSPDDPPRIDYRSFTDADGHDERMLVAGARLARKVASAEPLASHIVREVFPGPEVQTDEELSEVLRATHQTVYHVSCTCRMGAADDPLAVLDERLRVHGVAGLRVVDASSFPTLTALNPVGMVMTLAERAADLIRADA